MNPIQKLNQAGQSLWYDNIQRSLLENGGLAKLIADGEIRGVTSNPSIFNHAIAKSRDYDAALIPMAWSGWTTEEIFYQLAIEDIRAAADLFMPLYKQTQGGDGYVSLEVSPDLANDTASTLREAGRLWKLVERPNVMIKIPATPEGVSAIREAIAQGININVTLIFSLQRYQEVMDAYLTGLEQRVAKGLPVGSIASVASFFVSRVDTKVDAQLQEIIRKEGPKAELAVSLLGKAAIANARLAYANFQEVFNSSRFNRLKEKGALVQRPLWASTSTKNPVYKDVMYVEELIGQHTINTVPPQTLEAFREHGQVRPSLVEDVEEMRSQLKKLESLGISMDRVTYELEVEGVKAFADAFAALLGTLEERRTQAQEELGGLKKAVSARVAELEKISAVKRLYEHDPTLWTEDPAGQAEARKRMSWLDSPSSSRGMLADLFQFTREVVGAGFTHAVLLGMGGSSLAPEVMRNICGRGEVDGKPGLDLLVLDSTDPSQVKAAENWSPVERTLYIVSSKSGTTSEVNAYLDYFWELGKDASGHFIAVTDPGTSLDKLASERKFRRVFQADANVGGRYSALIAFGIVPAALMGLDVAKMLDRAEWIAQQCKPGNPTGRNPGVVLGAIIGEAALHGRDKVTFLGDTLWRPLGPWLEQLVAESSGKQGKGILPIEGEPLQAAEQYGPDRLFVYLRSDGELDALTASLRKAGHPVLTISPLDANELGAEFYRWEVAVAIACSIIGVNSFDQPDVQDSKDRTAKKVKEYQQSKRLDEGKPFWENEQAKLFGKEGTGVKSANDVSAVIREFLKQSQMGDYVAINAYLPRNPQATAELQEMRKRVQQFTGRPTTLGFGPRFQHSTGQLHKGGANNGLFIQITADPVEDVEIPGQDLSFGTLERAQALGDLEALLARGRRAIRVHLLKAKVKDLLA